MRKGPLDVTGLIRLACALLLGGAALSCADASPQPRRESLGRDARDQNIREMFAKRQHAVDASLLRELGRSLWTQGLLSDAESVYQELLKIDHSPNDAAALVEIRLLRGHYRDAAESARVSAEKHGRDAHPEWLTELWPQFQWFDVGPASQSAPTSIPRPAAGKLDPDMILLEGGMFARGVSDGEPDARPVRQVRLSPFWIGVHEVTAQQFMQFVSEAAYPYRVQYSVPEEAGQSARAMVGVSWTDARAFTMWLSAQTGGVYRLPTEAEWEFAARGPNGFREPWGNEQGQPQVTGNWALTSPSELRAPRPLVRSVGSFPRDRSPFGLMDMAGNASEWCLDEYDPSYYSWSQDRDPSGPVETTGIKVRRGGSWNSPWTKDFAVRRDHSAMNLPYTGFGFRVVREERPVRSSK